MSEKNLVIRGLLLGMLTLTATACAELDRQRLADSRIAIDRQALERSLASSAGTSAGSASASETALESTGGQASADTAYDPILPVTGDIPLSPAVAIMAALQHQPALRVAALNPQVRQTYEAQQRAVFDPVLDGRVQFSRTRTEAASGATATQEQLAAQVGLSQSLPTGTTWRLTASSDYSDRSAASRSDHATRVELSVTQSLLRGAGLAVNLVSLRQARLDVLSSEYELRGYVVSLVQEVEHAYWDFALAKRRIEIYEQSLAIAQQQLDEAQALVEVGKLAEVELTASQAEVALRHEDLINARANLQTINLQLLRLIGPTDPALWDRSVTLLAEPFDPQGQMAPVADHVALAMKKRADLNQARLSVQRGELDLIKTRNGLLPRLDLFMTLGRGGYAHSFGRSVQRVADGGSYDALVGLSLQYPLGNRDAQAAHRRATFSRQQQKDALENMERLAIVDVRSAHIQVERTRQQITATAATLQLQEAKLQNESEKFRVGKSTALLVAQAQRDLLAARIEQVNAVVSHLKAAVTLFAEDGSLLARRGIAAPGSLGVDGLDAWR